MNKNNKICLLILLIIFLSGCISTQNTTVDKQQLIATIPFNYDLFTNKQTNLAIDEDIYALTLSQKKEILASVAIKKKQGFKTHKALEQILSSRLSNFTYYGQTYNAEKVMRLNQGNCMSLAVLTTAYAKLLGLEYSYRKVNTLPIYEKKNNLILSSSHVQTIIYDDEFMPEDGKFYLSRPGIVIDYFPDTNNRISNRFVEAEFSSMYYRNLAADALVKSDLSKAFFLAEKAYYYNNQDLETISLLAVIHRRAGDEKTAEIIYKNVLEVGQSSLTLLNNYIVLLDKQQRVNEVVKFQAELDKLDDPNPYNWLEQAYIAQQKNDTKGASRYFKKALKTAPYLSEAYMGLYKIYIANNQFDKAQEMLRNALDWTYEINERKMYKSKLYSLQQY